MRPNAPANLTRTSAAVVLAATLMLGGIPAVAIAADQPSAPPQEQGQQQPPAKPGEGQPGQPPEGGPGGPGGAPGDMPGQPPEGGPGGGPNTQSFDYKGTYSATVDANGKSVKHTGDASAADADVNAALAQNGGTLQVSNGTLSKSGDDYSGDNCNFYGMNAALLSVGEKSHAYLTDATINANAEGANAIFATDKGTVFANRFNIATTMNSARGLDATYGGTIVAANAGISTQGDHCATLATDRGGGNVSLADSHLSTVGSGSPLLYSTGCIEVSQVSGTSSGSQIAGMEGLNTIRISNSTLESTLATRTASDPVANGIIIYQSMSGDADTSTGAAALFQATDSTLKSAIESGAMFYVTNTTANVVLKSTQLDFDSTKASLLRAEGNSSNHWGTAGKNGGKLNFTLRDETVSGAIEVDSISSAHVYLLDATTWTGAAKGEGAIDVTVGSDSTWVLTENATISSLTLEAGARIVDGGGKTVTVKADGQTVVTGDSALVLTVSGNCSQVDALELDETTQVSSMSIDRSGFDQWVSTGKVADSGSLLDKILALIGWPWW